MNAKHTAPTAGQSIEIRARVKRFGILKELDKTLLVAEFPPERLPPAGSTIYLNERLILPGTTAAENPGLDIEMHCTVQQQLDSRLIRAAISRIVTGRLADLQQAYDQGSRPALGHAATDITSVKALILHPMTTADGTPASDATQTEHFIQEIRCTHNGRVLLSGQWGRGMARDPYLAFEFTGGSKGEQIQLSWSDNLGNNDARTTTIK